MGLFDSLQNAGGATGLFSSVNQGMTPFTQQNQQALMGAGLSLLGGGGFKGAAQSFMAGSQADRESREQQLVNQMRQQQFQNQQTQFQQAQEDRQQERGTRNQTQEFFGKIYAGTELENAPVALQMADYTARRKGEGASYSKTPVYMTDPQTGQVALGTIGDDGSFKRIDTGGLQVAPGIRTIDTGTGTAIVDNRTGSVMDTLSKDIQGAEAQKVIGKSEGEKAAGREAAVNQMDDMLSAIDGALNAPGRTGATGMSGMFTAPFGMALPGSQTADFMARLDQLQGKAFLQAFESLRGGGSITEREGLAAQNAIARLQRSQSDEAFEQALMELKQIVQSARARTAGGQVQPSQGMQSAPDVNALIDKYGG